MPSPASLGRRRSAAFQHLVSVRESQDSVHISKCRDLILAPESSPWQLERHQQGWVKPVAPRQCQMPRYLPGCRGPIQGSAWEKQGIGWNSFCLWGLLLAFCTSNPSTSTPAPQVKQNLKDWFSVCWVAKSGHGREAQFHTDSAQVLPLLNNTQAE